MKYTISKNGNVLLSGHPDICNTLDHKTADQKAKLEAFGFPTECPVPEGRKCMDGTKKADISKFKNMLPMIAGKITAHYDVVHDTVRLFFFLVIRWIQWCYGYDMDDESSQNDHFHMFFRAKLVQKFNSKFQNNLMGSHCRSTIKLADYPFTCEILIFLVIWVFNKQWCNSALHIAHTQHFVLYL